MGLELIARYPAHLRPKSRQSFQYSRMAVDIVHDLELDQAFASPDEVVGPQTLDAARACLGCYYLASV